MANIDRLGRVQQHVRVCLQEIGEKIEESIRFHSTQPEETVSRRIWELDQSTYVRSIMEAVNK